MILLSYLITRNVDGIWGLGGQSGESLCDSKWRPGMRLNWLIRRAQTLPYDRLTRPACKAQSEPRPDLPVEHEVNPDLAYLQAAGHGANLDLTLLGTE